VLAEGSTVLRRGLRCLRCFARGGVGHAQIPEWLLYEFPEPLLQSWIAEGRGWAGKYKGQKQRWFLLRFVGDEAEIDLSGIGEQREFSEYKWLPMEQLPDWVVPFKRAVYSRVATEFSQYLQNNNRTATSTST
jgi:putative (di)nucleoside polyphosphate hydrolase